MSGSIELLAEPAHPSTDPLPTRPSVAARVATLTAVLLPFAGAVIGVIGLWGWGITWLELGLLLGMYLLTALGVTVGYHRLFTHRAFETTRSLQVVWGILGSMAVQGSLIKWAALHRLHHRHSDREGDPHSPHAFGSGLWSTLRGLWHAHIGWAFTPDPPDLDRYVPDLHGSRLKRVVSALFPLWAVLGLLLPAAIGGLLSWSWTGALLGFLWGGLVRVFLVHHVTWSVNSICHLWGSRPYKDKDQSRNNLVLGVLALGEGWHNNHHAFPTSARHGLYWWQIDVSYWVIKLLAFMGLAWKVRLPRDFRQSTPEIV